MNYSHPLELGTMGARPEDFSGQPTLVAIGNFDGVHLGHQAVLVDTAAEAKSNGWIPVALTFEPHPTVAVGRPPPACLTPVQRKIELIQRIDPSLRVVVQTFDEPFATQSPEAFVRTMLVDRLCARGVRVGENFRFGARRSGDLDSLADFGKQFGFEARAVPLLGDHQGRFSSTRARHAVAIGDLDEVWAIFPDPTPYPGKSCRDSVALAALDFLPPTSDGYRKLFLLMAFMLSSWTVSMNMVQHSDWAREYATSGFAPPWMQDLRLRCIYLILMEIYTGCGSVRTSFTRFVQKKNSTISTISSSKLNSMCRRLESGSLPFCLLCGKAKPGSKPHLQLR